MPPLRCEALGPRHDRASFACEQPSLTDYLRRHARKERDLGFGAVFVAVDPAESTCILGYYTLAAHAIDVTALEPGLRKRFPRYPEVPVVLLGRLARAQDRRGQGIGPLLLIDALRRALRARADLGAYAVVTDPINEWAAAFYERYQFMPLSGGTSRLFLPLETVAQLGL